MAESYIQILLKHCPNRSYIIGGFCMGGVVAFEMVKQLKNNYGIKNSALVLIDSFKLNNKFSDQEKVNYNKEQLKLRNIPEDSVLAQKIVFELNHNQKLVVNYFQESLNFPCLFIECTELLPSDLDNKNISELKKSNLGWDFSVSNNFIYKRKVNALHKNLFLEESAIKALGVEIKEFCSLLF